MSRFKYVALAALLGFVGGCRLSTHETQTARITPAPDARAPHAKPPSLAALHGPGPLRHDVIISAEWEVPRKGLINLRDPQAKADALRDEPVPIVLPVHVLEHPEYGLFVIDTGVSSARAAGNLPELSPAMEKFLDGISPLVSLEEIVGRYEADFAGVFLTHMHPDHVLGLPDVPADVPVYIGPGETGVRKLMHAFTRSSYHTLLDHLGPLQTLDFDQAPALGPVARALDVFGDQSLYVLATPGHTPGSIALLAHTQDGPVLITGDTSHTRYGFIHGVEPGTYTDDHAANHKSLEELRGLVRAQPEIVTYVGHEQEPVLAAELE